MSTTNEIVISAFGKDLAGLVNGYWATMDEKVSDEWKWKFHSVINEMDKRNRKLIAYCRSCIGYITTGKYNKQYSFSGCGCDYMWPPDDCEMRRRICNEYNLKTKFNSVDINDGVLLLSENNVLNLEWSKQYECIISVDNHEYHGDNYFSFRENFSKTALYDTLEKLVISHPYNPFILKYFIVNWRSDVRKDLEAAFIKYLKGKFIPKTEDEKMIDYCMEKFYVSDPKTEDEKMIDYCMECFYC